jgi:tripartite-type tricarboxylate transporter receptor subunit TctC
LPYVRNGQIRAYAITASARLAAAPDIPAVDEAGAFAAGHPADVVIINAQSPEQAIAEIAQPVAAFKNGRQTVRWDLPRLVRQRQL